MKNTNSQIPEGCIAALSQLAAITSQHRELIKFNDESYRRLVDNLSSKLIKNSVITDIVEKQARMLQSFNYALYSDNIGIQALISQWNTMAQIAESFQTPEIKMLKESLIRNEISAISTFVDSIKGIHIEAANIAFLKMAPIFESVSLPKGMKSVIKDIHVDTAKRLSTAENISFDSDKKLFYVEYQPQDTATVSETNILCSSLHLLSDIDEADLISFMNYLENHLPFASTHRTGRRINEIISEWNEFSDFDCDYYYHARALPEGKEPYTEQELRQAPYGLTWQGRYNYTGESHYYFSNVPKGALMEVAKHTKEKRVQIAKLKPKKSIRMIDLSQEITTQNKFLEFCRLKPNPGDYPNIKREYLLPCYVANCCELNGIEGIKYYGSKEYKNYVSWEDTYFDFVDSEMHNNI